MLLYVHFMIQESLKEIEEIDGQKIHLGKPKIQDQRKRRVSDITYL